MNELGRKVAFAAGMWIAVAAPVVAIGRGEVERDERPVASTEVPEAFRTAASRARTASECFERARGVLDGWWALRDPVTGLIPRRVDDPRWAPADNAADCFPFLVLAARFTEPERLDELREMMRREVELTTRLGWLPDWYSIPRRRFVHAEPDLERIVFGAAEYAKDGLNPLIELDGLEPWGARMRQLLDGIIERECVESDFGLLPAADTETNGELLQSLTRFYFATGDERYIELAERIGDAYCLEVLPNSGWIPAHQWDFTEHRAIRDVFNLNDHGNEIVGGLAELLIAVRAEKRESAQRYREPLLRMFFTLLEKARNEDGLWYSLIRPSTGEVLSKDTPDTWGYALAATLAVGYALAEPAFWSAAREALENIDQERYLEWNGADSYADSIEGGLLLLNRFPERAGFRWLEKVLPRFYACQELPRDGGTGIVEGWYGDGNYARTALMVALFATQGAFVQPWCETIELGGETEAGTLRLSLRANAPWSGRLHLDHPRHRDHFHLPWDWPRLNSFPEWFTVEPGELYTVCTITDDGGFVERESRRLGLELLEGLPIELDAGEALYLTVERAGEAPFGEERGPADPLAHLERTAGDPALVASTLLADHESYAGETYRWTKDAPIEWRVTREAGPIDGTLWLRWGSKDDARAGRVVIGEHEIELEDGGWDGFSWLEVDVPAAWWSGSTLDVCVEAPHDGGKAAFLSSMRLRATRFDAEPEGFSLRRDALQFEGSWRGQNNIPGYLGRGFLVSNAKGVATEPVRYEMTDAALPPEPLFVWVRGYEGDGMDRSFEVSIGGQRLEPTHRGKYAGRFSWQLAGHVQADGPTSLIEVFDSGDGFECFDELWLTTDPFFDPGAWRRIARNLFEPDPADDFLDRVIERCAEDAEAAHRRIAATQDDRDRWRAERARLQLRLRGALGLEPLPPLTPLNARTLGVLERDGYRIERSVFESRPGFPVTANLYLPAGDPNVRRPAVVCPTGHWDLAKTEPEVQSRCIGLALQGYVALTYDPFGQGERDVPGNDHYEYFRSIAVGRNNMSFMVWDTMRAIDYLLERPEVDPERIACTGCSGGGLNTLYAAAIDERIAVAVPVVYVSTLREFLGTRYSHCPCSHVNGLATFADMGDVVALNAPRPTLLITASRDPSFTPKGAYNAAEEARGAFEVLGAPEALRVHEVDAKHGYDREMREAMYGWLALHLLHEGDGSPSPEPTLETEEDLTALHCFEGGHVPEEWSTVRELNLAQARELAAVEPLSPRDVQRELAAWLGEIEPAREEPPDAGLLELRRRLDPDDARIPIAFATRAGPPIRGYRVAGTDDAEALTVFFHEGGTGAAHRKLVAEVEQQAPAYVLELRWTDGGIAEHVLATDAHLSGVPLLVRYARAVAEILESLRLQLAPGQRPILLVEGPRASWAVSLARIACATGEKEWTRLLHAGELAPLSPDGVGLFEGEIPEPDALAWRLLELGDWNRLREVETSLCEDE